MWLMINQILARGFLSDTLHYDLSLDQDTI